MYIWRKSIEDFPACVLACRAPKETRIKETCHDISGHNQNSNHSQTSFVLSGSRIKVDYLQEQWLIVPPSISYELEYD
jgi:hypothetical protein